MHNIETYLLKSLLCGFCLIYKLWIQLKLSEMLQENVKVNNFCKWNKKNLFEWIICKGKSYDIGNKIDVVEENGFKNGRLDDTFERQN